MNGQVDQTYSAFRRIDTNRTTSHITVQNNDWTIQAYLALWIMISLLINVCYLSVFEMTILMTSGAEASSSLVLIHVSRPLITTFFFPEMKQKFTILKLKYGGRGGGSENFSPAPHTHLNGIALNYLTGNGA